MEPDVFKRLQGAARREPVELPAELWTKIVYNMAPRISEAGRNEPSYSTCSEYTG
jgi:hypothetical protein